MTKKITVALATFICASTFALTTQVQADNRVNMQNESIYDVIVDRFFDKNAQNNPISEDGNQQAYYGGDFGGIETKISYFDSLDFTYLSIGSIAEADDFQGKQVINYSSLQKNLGTQAEYESMYEALHKIDIKIMADFPINGVSEKNTLISQASKGEWVTAGEQQGTVNWLTENEEVQKSLIDAAVNYSEKYKLDGIRLSNIEGVDTAFLNQLIEALKEVNPRLAIISDGPSDANFDLNIDEAAMDNMQQIFKNQELDSSALTDNIVEKKAEVPTSLMMDNLSGTRFTYFAAAENMFPPTRVKLALGAELMLPGMPIMTYGTEITMNGEAPPETLQGMDFRTKDDIITYIGQLQALRNGSNTLRNGDFKLLENDNGYIVFERSSKEEKWIIVINNTNETKSIDLTEAQIGKNKEMIGMLEKDIIRETDQSVYRVGLERELVEVYQVRDKKGINVAYLLALGLVYILFIGFIVAVLKRGKKRRATDKNE